MENQEQKIEQLVNELNCKNGFIDELERRIESLEIESRKDKETIFKLAQKIAQM